MANRICPTCNIPYWRRDLHILWEYVDGPLRPPTRREIRQCLKCHPPELTQQVLAIVNVRILDNGDLSPRVIPKHAHRTKRWLRHVRPVTRLKPKPRDLREPVAVAG